MPFPPDLRSFSGLRDALVFCLVSVLFMGFSPMLTHAQADLTMSVSGVPAEEIRGGNFTAQYSVHNQGPDNTSGSVVVTIALDNATIQTLTGGGTGAVSQTDDQNATITYPSFPAGLTITNDVVIVTNGSGGDATVTISVSTGNDSNTTNNSFTATVTVPTRAEGDLNGTVYKDVNKNGEVDSSDTPIEGVQVGINTGLNRTTNAEGFFEFIDLFRRPYDVTVTLPDGYTMTIPSTNPFGVNVEDGGVTTVVILLNDENEPVPGRISGKVLGDRDGTGIPAPMEGVRVFDDLNENGVKDANELDTLTDANGEYEFNQLIPNITFRVRVEVPLWATPFDPNPAYVVVPVTPGLDTEVNFIFQFAGSLSGFLYLDNDADGSYDETVDQRAVDQIENLELLSSSGPINDPTNVGDDLLGEFDFIGLYRGEYRVNWPFRTEWEISEEPLAQTLTEEAPFASDLHYGIYERVNIRGEAFYDLNENGTREAGEPPAQGIDIACSSSGDCQGMTDTSDIQGVFLIDEVQPGTFTIDLTAPEGVNQIIAPAGGQFQFTLNSGQDNLELQIAVRPPQNGLPYPDLTPSMTVAPAFPAPGDEVTYTIIVTNQGQAVALQVGTRIPLLSTEFVSATTTQGGCNFDSTNSTVECTHLSLDPGDSVSITLVVRTTVPGALTAVATASTTSEEPFDGNNSVTLTGQVTDPDISVSLVTSDHQTCTPEWEPLPGVSQEVSTRSTTDGNMTRFSVRVLNEHPLREEVVTLEMSVDGETAGQPVTLTLPPLESETASFSFETRDKAWKSNGDPRVSPYQILFTVRRGEAELVDLPVPLEVLPRPLVLVHGLWSNASTWDSWEGYAMAAHPGWEGRVFAVNTMDMGVSPRETLSLSTLATGDYPLAASNFTTRSIADNADALEAFIADIREQTGSCHIELVAHSMGGLISRRFIHELMPPLEADGQKLMDDLIMLGTPNQGSPCTDQVLAGWAAVRGQQEDDPLTNPSDLLPLPPTNIIELSKRSVARFNELVTEKKGVIFKLLAGNPARFTCLSPQRGDLFVEHASAIALSSSGIVDSWNTQSILHTSMTSTSSVFTDFVLPILKPDSEEPGRNDVEQTGIPETARFSASSSPEDYVEIFSAALPVGGDGATFQVGTADSLSFMIIAPSDVSTMVMDPNGTVVWNVQAGSEDAAGWFRTTTVDALEQGEWRVVLDGSDATAAVAVHALNAAFDLDAEFGEPVNDIVPVTASISGGASAVVSVSARIDGADPVTVLLTASGNGVFEGEVPVGRAGTASITVEAQLDGEVRRIRDWVEIATVTENEATVVPSAFLLAEVFPNPIQGNATLEVHLPVDTDITVRLFDTLGRAVERITQTHLPAGIHRVPLQIDTAAGVYLLVIDTRNGRSFRRVVISR